VRWLHVRPSGVRCVPQASVAAGSARTRGA
jgi:hypothetical protein